MKLRNRYGALFEIELGPQIGAGYTAHVFQVRSAAFSETIVAKVYDPQQIPDNVESRFHALYDRELHKIGGAPGHLYAPYHAVAAPLGVLVNDDASQVIGVAVRRVNTVRFKPMQSRRGPAHGDLNIGLVAATRLWTVAAELHRMRVVIGDVSDRNILVDEEGHVTFIDVDSFGVDGVNGDPNIPSTHSTPNFEAPEHSREASVINTRESDVFSLGVLSVPLLLGGRRPAYGGRPNGVGTSIAMTTQDLINEGKSWLLSTRGLNLPEDLSRHPGLRCLPKPVSALVQDTLAVQPSKRPTSSLWRDVLQALEVVTLPCGHKGFEGCACRTCNGRPTVRTPSVRADPSPAPIPAQSPRANTPAPSTDSVPPRRRQSRRGATRAAGRTLVIIAIVLLAAGGSSRLGLLEGTSEPPDYESFSAAQQELLDRVPSQLTSTCEPAKSGFEGPGSTAALACGNEDSVTAVFIGFDSPAATRSFFEERSEAVDRQNCQGLKTRYSFWSRSGVVPTILGTADKGRLKCFARGDVRYLLWSSQRDVVAIAGSTWERRRLYGWWQDGGGDIR